MIRESVQKRLSGELIGWNLETRMVHVRFKKWWETGECAEATASFLLDPYAVVTSTDQGLLRLSEFKLGQRITLFYVTGADGRPVAKTLTLANERVPVST